MSVTTITKNVFIQASPETVWAYLTEASKLEEWFHPSDKDLALEEPYRLLKKADDQDSTIIWGKVLAYDKPSKLVYTFTIPPMGEGSTTVTWKLDAFDGGTRVTLIHEGIESIINNTGVGLLFALDAGWDEHFQKLRHRTSNS